MSERDAETHEIIGAAMEVHNVLGPGFLEAVYQDALAVEFARRGIPFEREVEISIVYKDVRLPSSYRVDYQCYGSVIVELKAIRILTGADEAQLLNYLKATAIKRGLLLNFGSPRLQYKRMVVGFDPDDQ